MALHLVIQNINHVKATNKTTKQLKKGRHMSVMDINEGNPVTKILIINMEINRGARVNFPTIMKNANKPSATAPHQDFRLTSLQEHYGVLAFR